MPLTTPLQTRDTEEVHSTSSDSQIQADLEAVLKSAQHVAKEDGPAEDRSAAQDSSTAEGSADESDCESYDCEDGDCGECSGCCSMAFADSLGVGDFMRDLVEIWATGGVGHVNMEMHPDGSTTSSGLEAVYAPQESDA